MECDFEKLESMVKKELNSLTNQPSLSGEDLDKMIKAICYLDQAKDFKEKEKWEKDSSYRRMSYGWPHEGVYPRMSYDGGISYERGRSPRTGQYISRSDGYEDGRSYHSIADRMVSRLEQMYDEATSPHEKETIGYWIDKIRTNG